MSVAELKHQIDKATATAFLTEITRGWGDLPEPVVLELRCLFPGRSPQVSRFSPDAMGIELAVELAEGMNSVGINIYPVINPVRSGRQLTGKAATDADIVAAFWHWADSDDEASADALRAFAGPRPNMVVITGQTPLVRPHAYWRIADGPVTDLAAWRTVQEGIAATFGSDRTVVNASRIMRLPGMINWPTPDKEKKGRVPEISTMATFPEREPVPFERMQRTFGGARPATASASLFDIDTGGDYAAPLDRERARIQALGGMEWHNAVIKLVASYVAKGLSDAEIHGLTDPLTLPGYTVDDTRREVQTAIDGARRKGWTPEPGAKTFDTPGPAPAPSPQIIADFRIKSSDEFLSDLEPLEYLIDGILPSGVVYSLTGYPGHGKTTLAIQFGLSVALGRQFAERDVTPGDVLFLAGENPYNLKWQYAAALEAAGVTTCERMHFVEGHFSISAMIEVLKQKMADLPNLKLIIIDSLQAFFEGDDDNANIKMVEAARRFREVGNIESRPGILVIAHPAGKEPRKDNLVPRGGGAFLAEIDGNLTVWSPGDDMQSLHHSPKFRGAGFEPIEFIMATCEFDHLTDTNGTPLKLKVSRKAFQIEEATRADHHNNNLRRLLLELSAHPRMSIREIESRTGITKSVAHRLLKEAQEERLIKRHAKGWKITDGGEEFMDV